MHSKDWYINMVLYSDHLLVLICLVNLFLTFDVTRKVFAHEKIICSTKTFIPFQRSYQLIIIVRPKNATSDKRFDFFELWVRDKLDGEDIVSKSQIQYMHTQQFNFN